MLASNDTLALFCTGSPSTNKQEPHQTAQFLKSQHQLNAVYGPETYRQLPAKERAEIFLEYLFNDEIKALWALRGGEGSADTLPFIHRHKKRIAKLSPKPLIGFSDITALLVYFAQHYNWPVIHGPGALQLIHSHLMKRYQKQVINYLFTGQTKLPTLTPLNEAAKQQPEIKGHWTGGNLTLLSISIGDLWEINTRNKIILLEDVNEPPHAVRRTLHYLARLGKFKTAKAIVLGEFLLKTGNLKEQQALRRILLQFAEEQRCPVFKTNQIGHGRRNTCIAFNTPYR